MSKYIIQNCPNYLKTHNGNYCDFDAGCCQDCTDCVMKQIVELCKHYIEQWKAIPNVDILEGCVSNKILKLLDIEEVE